MKLRLAVWTLVGAAAIGSPLPGFADLPPQPGKAQTPDGLPLNPEHEELKIEAESAYKQGNFPRAVELASKVISLNPKDHVAYYLRASARVEYGRQKGETRLIRQGVEDARESLKHGGTDHINYYLPYLYGMTSLGQIEGRPEHAEICVKIAATVLDRQNLKPEDRANVLYQRANASLMMRKYDAAVTDFGDAIKLMPQHLGAYVGRADAYVAAGKKEQALDAFAAAIKAFPSNPLIYNQRGLYLQKVGQGQEAILDFSRAIDLDPNYYMAYTNRGYALMNEGSPQAAEGDFAMSLKLDSNQPLVYSLRGTARLLQGRTQAAIEDYQQVVKLDAGHPAGYADLGFARFFGKDYTGAIRSFEQAKAVDSKARYLDPWIYWSMILSGPQSAADARYAETLKKSVIQRDSVDQTIYYLSGNATEKQLLATISTDLKPETKTAQLCEAYFFIGERLRRNGDQPGAATYYQQALDTQAKQLSAYRGAQYALGKFVAETANDSAIQRR